jgi:hypothetical protein
MYLNIETTKKLFTTTYEVYIDWGENSNYFAEKLVAHQKGGNFNDHYTSHVGGSNPMSLMQKSIAVYIWKRTA